MNNLTNETNKVYEAVKIYSPVRSSELGQKLKISSKNLYKHLGRLLDEHLISKTGSAPKVFYFVADSANSTDTYQIQSLSKSDLVLDQNYIYVSPSGVMIRGVNGFEEWCKKNQFNFQKEKTLFVKRLKLFEKLKRHGLISAKKIILSGKKELYLDNIFFSDFYNFDYFGKTKLGQLVYLGKSSQNKDLIYEIGSLVNPSLEYLIEKYNIDYVCFIPPTINRKIQFLDVLKKSLKIDLPEIKAVKVNSVIKIPQKTIKKLEDRIVNAKETIAVSPAQNISGNVLIIDDATGSGATINETAKKIRLVAQGKIKIIGYSVVGSYKGFDVISEV